VTVREIANVPGAEAQIKKIALSAYLHAEKNMTELQLEFGDNLRYGFTNAKEFMAEALSNKDFRNFYRACRSAKRLQGILGSASRVGLRLHGMQCATT